MLDRLVELAATACGAPIALMSLIGADRQWIKARVGLTVDRVRRGDMPCARAIEDARVLVVPDVGADERFRHAALVVGPPAIRSYAGAPLITADGHRVGVLCVCHRQPTALDADQLSQLERLAGVAVAYMEMRGALREAQAAAEAGHARITELEFAHSMLEEQAANLVELAEDRDELYQANLRQAEFIETLVDTVPIPIFARDPALRITHANPAYAAFVGVDRSALLGTGLEGVVGAETLQAVAEEDRLLLAEPTGRRAFEKRVALREPGAGRDIILHKARIRAADGSSLGIVGAIVDVTEAKALQARLEQIAATDPLTGAANRRAFIEKADAELRRSVRTGRPLSLIMIDIDKFKAINDLHGHQTGDEVLRRVAGLCMGSIRDSIDLFARFGGEEFVVILPETDAKGAAILAERLRRTIARQPVACDGASIEVTASFGVSALAAEDGGLDEALKRADACLYRSKQNGRNRVTVHEEADAMAPA